MEEITDELAVRWMLDVLSQVQVQGTMEQVERQIALAKRSRELLNGVLEDMTGSPELREIQ